MITGSKDKIIKIFYINKAIKGNHNPHTLKPHNFDDIETFLLTEKGRTLFSGDQNGTIKKWDLTDKRLTAVLNNCHKSWVLAINTFQEDNKKYLLTACKSGFLRIWGTENLNSILEIHAHQESINSITTNSNNIFTASNDCKIKLWQFKKNNM